MPVKKQPQPKKKVAAKTAVRAPALKVSGDSSVKSIQIEKPKAAKALSKNKAVTKKEMASKPISPKVVSIPTLISVTLDENGAASVSRYAGLFFVFVGVCFAARALSFIHIETKFLTDVALPISSTSSLKAEVITANAHISAVLPSSPPIPAPVTITASSSSDIQRASTTDPTEDAPASTVSETESGPEESLSRASQDEFLKPSVALTLKESSEQAQVVDITIDVLYAELVEMYATPNSSLSELYLGRAYRVTEGVWEFALQTSSLPKSTYSLSAHVRNSYGTYQSQGTPFTVDSGAFSAFEVPPTLEIKIDESNEVERARDSFNASESGQSITEELLKLLVVPPTLDEDVAASSTASTTARQSADVPADKKALAFLLETEQDFNQLLAVFTAAQRGADVSGTERVRERLAEFERQRIERIATDLLNPEQGELIAQVRDRLAVLMRDEISRVEKRELAIISGFDAVVSTDTDRDGISDYDEERIYGTNPKIADTDSDGFTDGAEIISGFDPKDARVEIVVASESPKEKGIERTDILVVSNLQTIERDTSSASATPESIARVVFSGRALPSSFVTLSIFSSPLSVTVKSSPEGSWQYVFDKELENGEHQVFASMTDNSGRIVAKSSPFTFVKEGDTYTIGAAEGHSLAVSPSETRLFSESVFVLVSSLGVIMLGLVLLLLGVHFGRATRATAQPIGSAAV